MTEARPAILVLAPMPAYPVSAGNRRRLLATSEALQRGGFAVDLAYYAHEDQIYRRFGQHPPTDLAAMEAAFRRVFVIEPRATIPLKTRARAFGIDEWCPDEVGDFVAWYCARFPETGAVLVNYVFLSRALERVPPGVLGLIDTHDRFAGRQTQYRPFRAEPNFFYTDETGEAAGLDRADIVLAIQSAEARYFEGITSAAVHLLPPAFPVRRAFEAPRAVRRIGFLGHGNDPNLFSIGRFAQAWAEDWTPARPELVIAGEICRALGRLDLPGVRLLGYLDRIETFYEGIDLVVAPMLMGSGLKMKVGEALSFGVPVIGTAIGFEGFDPVEAAHTCQDAGAVKEAVLAVHDDPAALARLTAACEDLFARYDAGARRAEADLIAILRDPAGRPDAAVVPRPEPEEPPRLDRGAAVTLVRETSARSSPAADPERGVLVATERRPGDGSEAAYYPHRRRWFARADASLDPGSDRLAGLGAVDLALSPEWVRDRALPPQARAALAPAFAEIGADWETAGTLVGRAGDRIEIVTLVPGVLASGTHPAACFLIAPDGASATEWRVERMMPLQIRTDVPYENRSGRLPAPVPVSLGLRCAGTRPAFATGRLLFLTDDAVGRIAIRDAAAGEGSRP